MKSRAYIIAALVAVLIFVAGVGTYLLRQEKGGQESKSEAIMAKDIEEVQKVDEKEAGGETEPEDKESGLEKSTSDKLAEYRSLKFADTRVRWEETAGDIFYGEKSGCRFYEIGDALTYEAPGEKEAFLSVEDGTEVVNYGKKSDYIQEGRTVLAKAIGPDQELCLLEQDGTGRLFVADYRDGERRETALDTREITLRADFFRSELLVDTHAIYVKAAGME